MLFNSLEFCGFVCVFFVLYTFVSKNHSYKLWLLTVASLVFYGSYNWKFVPLLLGTRIVGYYFALAIADATDPKRRTRLATISVSMNLIVLGFFKYMNFFLASVQDGAALVGARLPIRPLDIVVPLGISFYTFMSIGHTIDVYRKNFKPQRHLLAFVASSTFFPYLGSGPIARSSQLLPQFEKLTAPEWKAVQRGVLLIASGLAKKAVADLLAPIVAAAFVDKHVSMLEAWTGALAFSAQIYGDFAGYTDIALGVSALVGFTLPPNFNLPYISTSPADFWRRWHISLSTWMRDYLYMPLLFRNRKVYLSLFITMTLCGVWHGANWTFLLYGAYHGLLVAVDAAIVKRLPRGETWPMPVRLLQMLFTLYLVTLGFVLFRATSLAGAWRVFTDLHHVSVPSVLTSEATRALGLTVAALVACHVVDYVILHVKAITERAALLWTFAIVLMGVGVALSTKGQPFIYLQF